MDKKTMDLGQSFDSAPKQEQSENTPDIATKAELDKRISQRNTPNLEQHHTIGGTLEQSANDNVDKENEARINYLENRLSEIQPKQEFEKKTALDEKRINYLERQKQQRNLTRDFERNQ